MHLARVRTIAIAGIMSALVGWALGTTVDASATTYYGIESQYGAYRGWTYKAHNEISNDTTPGRALVIIQTLNGNYAPAMYMGVRPRMYNYTTGNLCAQSSDWIYNGSSIFYVEAYAPKASTCIAYNSYYSQGQVRMSDAAGSYVTKTPGATDLMVLP